MGSNYGHPLCLTVWILCVVVVVVVVEIIKLCLVQTGSFLAVDPVCITNNIYKYITYAIITALWIWDCENVRRSQ